MSTGGYAGISRGTKVDVAIGRAPSVARRVLELA